MVIYEVHASVRVKKYMDGVLVSDRYENQLAGRFSTKERAEKHLETLKNTEHAKAPYISELPVDVFYGLTTREETSTVTV